MMINIKRILCPTDLSPHSGKAVRYAVALARGGRQSEAKSMARELTAKNASDLSPDLKALLDELIKS